MILGIGKKKKAAGMAAEKTKSAKTAAKKTAKTEALPEDYALLLKPIITEKSTLVAANNQIVFKVAVRSDKRAIKRAVERVFSVKVETVNTICQKGKVKRLRGVKGRRGDFKKAVVTLAKGHSIDLGAGV